MGTWDNKPYDNDAAADWFAGIMDSTKLRDAWAQQLTGLDIQDEPEIARAAVWLFIQLGRVYVWPIENYKADLDLAIATAEKLKESDQLLEMDGMAETLEQELRELLARKR